MKILLLGEFSALHKNLKEGLIDLGHEVVTASSGDGFKKIPADIPFNSNLPGVIGKIHRKLVPLLSLKKLSGFDVVQLINPFIFGQTFYANYIINRVIKNNNKFFVLGAGDDAYFWKFGRERLEYGPFDDFLKYDLKSSEYYMQKHKAFTFNKDIIERSRGLIPIMYEYGISYKGHNKLLDPIPIPINLNKIKYKENLVGNKLVIFHGISRYGFKGTRHVEKAFEYLKSKYPNDLELIIDGKLPMDKYLTLMQKTNVVIDQVNSHSLGVNGVYALAMGKVVLGGAEKKALKYLGINSSPVINIKPNAESIIFEIESLLDRRNEIPKLGYESRKFAEDVHSHTKIAQQYINTWSKC